ncbi:triose-phosphate isomerase [Bartonella tamiae]|uniref:Triosephosphate isomerase n=1 Tax=Bartonella tamiae Th239 TaxID=1094558 RepID=J0ZQ22_9HYPH|nr:triose-phosphate isomerase [Bartonella tamiae]EJF90713.1 triose-phosphate isomerase [Bartonella tamiae Th239]EJF93910.1 triose-phosphate isomerase [Bartonella tamiae Th307]
MTPNVRPLVAGNWKMNGTGETLTELRAIASGVSTDLGLLFEALICVPATLISRAADVLDGEKLLLGGQDCHTQDSGAHTGDISAPMLKEAGASYVIVGHSERRTDHHETDEIVHKKAQAAWHAGLKAIICVGETLAQRDEGITLEIIGKQLNDSVPNDATNENTIIAYEPVWAIGTGKTSTVDDVTKVHAFIRKTLNQRFGSKGQAMQLLYGGSVKPSNAHELLAVQNVDGALVGGASLKATDFLAICEAYRKL